MKRACLFALAILPGSLFISQAASTRNFNYAVEQRSLWGSALLESYDLAIRIDDPSLVGKRILSVEIPVSDATNTSNWKIWLSSELRLEKKVNIPDIASADISPENGKASIIFPEPFLIPEGGLYVGYSFTVSTLTETTRQPVVVSPGGNENTLFVHSSRKYPKWTSMGSSMSADISLTLEGDFKPVAAEISSCMQSELIAGEEWTPTFTLRNHGEAPISSISYLLTSDGDSFSGTLDFEEPIPAIYWKDNTGALPAVMIEESGTRNWSLAITEINGEPNSDPSPEGEGILYAYPYAPQRRPLLEEFTGTWCGWCARGIVGLEKMKEKYGDEFIAVVYHTDKEKDPMVTTDPKTDYPGAPSCKLDRRITADPFYGEKQFCLTFGEGIEEVWLKARRRLAPVDLALQATLDEESQSATGELEMTFMREYRDSDLRVVWMLTADGLSGDSREWRQSNYFSDEKEYLGGDLDVMVNAPRYITDMKFDDVLLHTPDVKGVPGSIPETVRMSEKLTDKVSIPLSAAVTTDGASLIQPGIRMHLVAAVVEATSGEVLNAISAPLSDVGGIDAASVARSIVSRQFYNLQGYPIPDPQERKTASPRTPYIQIEKYSDGTQTTTRHL